MNIQPVYGERAIYIPEEKTIIVADLHIGIEYELEDKGVIISMQTKKLLERILKITGKKRGERIVILGDLKHTIENREYMMKERREIGYFLKELSKHAEIWIVKGNHDGRIRSKYAKIYGGRGILMGDIFMAHGHAWPSDDIINASVFVMAHLHPHIRIMLRSGYTYMEPCWIVGKFNKNIAEKYPGINTKMKVIVMPSFNPVVGGIAVNKEKISYGIAGMINWHNSVVYLLNGVNLGRIKNLS